MINLTIWQDALTVQMVARIVVQMDARVLVRAAVVQDVVIIAAQAVVIHVKHRAFLLAKLVAKQRVDISKRWSLKIILSVTKILPS